MTLTAFLLARIGEDEEVAQAAIGRQVTVGASWEQAAVLAHIERWSSARVLAECAAKRAIVKEYLDLLEWSENEGRYATEWDTLSPVICILASVYADHPDYQPEWRP